MALINCPECNQQISDCAKSCPHCGFPMNLAPNIDSGDNYNVVLQGFSGSKLEIIKCINNTLAFGLKKSKEMVDNMPSLLKNSVSIDTANKIKQELELFGAVIIIEPSNKSQNDVLLSKNYKTDTISCPRCGSTAITTGKRGFSFITGFLGSNKTVNRCGKCGYSWQPK